MNEQLTLLGVALSAGVTVIITPGKFDWWDSILGWVLLFILLAYSNPINLSTREKIAHSGVAGLCTLIGLVAPINGFYRIEEGGDWWMLAGWFLLTGAYYWLAPLVRTFILRRFASTTTPSAGTP